VDGFTVAVECQGRRKRREGGESPMQGTCTYQTKDEKLEDKK